MLIPSIDLMDGKIVQLVQGEKKALEFTNFDDWITKFAPFPLIQLIDLDAAMGKPPNSELVRRFVVQLPCQVGGGIRSVEAVRTALESGARRVIVGSSLVKNGAIDVNFAEQLAREFGPGKLVFAIDAKGGHVAIGGWQENNGDHAAGDDRSSGTLLLRISLYTHRYRGPAPRSAGRTRTPVA